jgi:hypothetical protein
MMLTIAIETEITGIAVLYSNLPWTKEDDERLRAFVAQGASVIRAAAARRSRSELAPVRSGARSRSCGSGSRPIKFTTDRPHGDPEKAALRHGPGGIGVKAERSTLSGLPVAALDQGQ